MRCSTIDLPWVTGVLKFFACAAVCMSAVGEAAAKPRVERVVERRIMRLETMERRMEAAAQLPPRPVDVRRALRAGVPVQDLFPGPTAPNAFARPMPRGVAPAATAPVATAAPAAAQARPAPVAQVSPRVVPQPSQAKPVPSPAEPPAEVSPVTAVDDGTRSVLVGGEQPARPNEAIEPIELLPPPPAQ